MTLIEPPCKDCPSRFVGCHGACPTWKAWQAAETEKRAQCAEAFAMDKAFQDIAAQKSTRYYRRLRNGRRHPNF